MKDITGREHNGLIALLFAYTEKERALWVFKCFCGSEFVARPGNVWTNGTRSCGCLARSSPKKRSKLTTKLEWSTYDAWVSMRKHCWNRNDKDYHYYGGRRIKFCVRWVTFENFLIDMGVKPTAEHSLDRINNDGDYEPTNCRWATKTEQANNRRPRSNSVLCNQ